MTPPEQIIAFLREHPDSTRAQISEHCGHEQNWAWRWVRVLVLQGNVVSRKINKSDVRYTLIDDAIKDIRVDGRYNATIRSLVEFEKFQKDVRPIIASMPGRSAALYAEMLGQHISSVSRRLNEMQRMGILFSDRRRRRKMKNKTALWWIKGYEPEDLDSVETPEEQLRDRQFGKYKKMAMVATPSPVSSIDNDRWFKEIIKTREQRRLERLMDENQQMPIPSYSEFFKRQEGRN
jgi:hypothetical protein